MNFPFRVCTIGGGSGMPIVNKSLVAAGLTDICSIVTTFDNGGDTGRMRTDERGKILAFSDYWRSLISLWKDGKQKENWEEMLRYRDGRSRNFGNMFFQFMSEKTGDLSNVGQLFCTLTGANLMGSVIPVSNDPSNVCFETISGKKYCGESCLDDLRMSYDKVKKIWLEPDVSVNFEVVDALNKADLVIVCPGSMYGSVLTNFLPKGMKRAYQNSRAKKMLMTNIMSVANENDQFDQCKYVEAFEKYLGKSPFDYVLMADLSKLNKKELKIVESNYAMEHSFPIKICPEYDGAKVFFEDITVIDKIIIYNRCYSRRIQSFYIFFVICDK